MAKITSTRPANNPTQINLKDLKRLVSRQIRSRSVLGPRRNQTRQKPKLHVMVNALYRAGIKTLMANDSSNNPDVNGLLRLMEDVTLKYNVSKLGFLSLNIREVYQGRIQFYDPRAVISLGYKWQRDPGMNSDERPIPFEQSFRTHSRRPNCNSFKLESSPIDFELTDFEPFMLNPVEEMEVMERIKKRSIFNDILEKFLGKLDVYDKWAAKIREDNKGLEFPKKPRFPYPF